MKQKNGKGMGGSPHFTQETHFSRNQQRDKKSKLIPKHPSADKPVN